MGNGQLRRRKHCDFLTESATLTTAENTQQNLLTSPLIIIPAQLFLLTYIPAIIQLSSYCFPTEQAFLPLL